MIRLPSLASLVLATATVLALVAAHILSAAEAGAVGLLCFGAFAVAAFARGPEPEERPRAFFDEAVVRPTRVERRPTDLAHLETDVGIALRDETRLRSRVVPVVAEVSAARETLRVEEVPAEVGGFLAGGAETTIDGLRRALDALERT